MTGTVSFVEQGKWMKTDWKAAFAYWFAHFATELICFYTICRLFENGEYWWAIAILYDVLAFFPQAVWGRICEKHPDFRPGVTGGILMMTGAAVMLLTAGSMNGCIRIVTLMGLILLTVGNGFVHISGALATIRVSEGRLSESAVFVGGGSFGLIAGKLLSGADGIWAIPFVLMTAAVVIMARTDRNIRKRKTESGIDVFDFTAFSCKHDLAADRAPALIAVVLTLVVAVRAYIGYGLPTAWNTTVVRTIFLYIFMGSGKMLGGILSDRFGARLTGIVSCLLSVPMLLLSDNIMWLSLVGVALFSMTIAVTLGGLVSVMPKHPGVAFGLTTIALITGSLPVFISGLPSRAVSNTLIAVMSVLAAAGLFFSLKRKNG